MSVSHQNDRRALGGATAVLAFTFSPVRMPAIGKLTIFAILAIFPLLSRAANITLQGNFTADDNVQLFSVSIAAPAAPDIRSYGYGGGTTSTGAVVPRGGFDTILTLFSASGVFIDDNDDGAGVAADPTTGLVGDARITTALTPGSYIVALTQYDNFSNGNLADGFAETGHPNFTADPAFTTGGPCPGNMFRDISGTAERCRTGGWAVDFVNVASVTPVAATPEPSALHLAGLGLGLLLVSLCRSWRKAPLLAGGLVAALASVPINAQTNSGPDYNQVSDFLNGQRSLLKVTDLQTVFLEPDVGPVYTQIRTSNSNQTSGATFNWGLKGIDASKPALNFSAHMFNQSSAITITTLHNFNNFFALWLQNIASNGTSAWTPLAQGDEPDVCCGAVADFTQDGFDDLALGLGDGRILVVSPNNTDPSTQPFTGSFHSSTPIVTLNVLKAMAAGDFNGDGRKELAGLTVVPNDQPGGGGLALEIYTVDPNSLAVTPVGTLVLTTPGASASSPITYASMARGRFNSAGHDQLAVAFATNSGPAYVEIIDFTPNTLTPKEASPTLGSPAPTTPISPGYIQVKTGKFGLPNTPYDQIVYHSSSENNGGRFFEILTVKPTDFTIGGTSPLTYFPYACAAGIEVGNFDHRQPVSPPDPTNPGATEPNLNDQIAFLYCNGRQDSFGNQEYTMNIYNADPNSLSVDGGSGTELDLGALANNKIVSGLSFAATDLQGRSVILGEPTKINIQNPVQPSVVVGVPPMHVDYISPDPVDKVPATVFNVSAIPDGFQTTYQQVNSNSFASSTTSSTSWSFGSKESFTGGITVGNPKIDGVKYKDTFTAAQNLKGDSGKTHDAFTGKTFNVSATTGFGDEVTYVDNNDFNIWVYPVIGQTVCPTNNPNCQPGEQVPLTIQFSAPNGDSLTTAAQGQGLPWYQPPWEPGNIFSYPANLQQLQAIYPNLAQLTNPLEFLTDSSTITQTTNWSVTTKDSPFTSLNQNYSFENDFSINGSVGIANANLNFGLDIDLSGSFGFNTLTKNTTTLGQSTGIEVSKPGTFAVFQNYGYSVAPYVMGNMQQGGMVDNQPLSGDVQTVGLLRAMFTADPLSSVSGKWWQQAYGQTPDVALNHPSRWQVGPNPLKTPIPSNCLATGKGGMDCADLSSREPNNPALSDFHQMRGFFISSAAFPGQGPQLEQAKAGDVLTLQARVYNYSLKSMDSSSAVHVRFYFMPWDTSNGVPAGDSVLINEVAADPIPAFSESSVPNWVLVPTTFDTGKFDQTKAGNVSLVFWVLVWMQDQNGKIQKEISGHGLTAIPGTLTSFADATKLEECQSDGNCYSNNLGVYPQVFYIASTSLEPSPSSPGALVDIGKLELSAHRVTLGANVVLSATLSAGSTASSGATANFYDGDPNDGGRIIAVKRIAHIAEDAQYKVQTSYRSTTCGTHALFVAVNQGKPSEVVRRAPPLRVTCGSSLAERE